MVYSLGKLMQLIGLMILPSALWVGHFGHNEPAAIAIFVGAIAVFYLGYGVSRLHRNR